MDWLSDRELTAFGRHRAPVIQCPLLVDGEQAFMLMGLIPNRKGQPLLIEWQHIDAVDGITEHDAHVAGYILERGRAVVVAVNKWDAADSEQREKIKSELGWKVGFLGFAKTLYISARNKKGLGEVMTAVDKAYAAAMVKLATPKLTRALIVAVEKQSPPRRGMGRPKLRYAHQGGQNPPTIIIHGNQLDHIPETYRRYLEGVFRTQFALEGTPMRIEFRTGRNPHARREQGLSKACRLRIGSRMGLA